MKATNKKQTTKKHQPQCSLPESAGAGKCSLFLGRLDQGLVGNAESTHVNRPKGKAMLVPKVGRYCKFLKSNNERLTICDKNAQPVELGENWLGASVMVNKVRCLKVNRSETVEISCQLR